MYIGSSNDPLARKSKHLSLLRRGLHKEHLQHWWDIDGEDKFVFRILEFVDSVRDLRLREQYWLDLFPEERKFNISPSADSTIGVKHTKETKAKISK